MPIQGCTLPSMETAASGTSSARSHYSHRPLVAGGAMLSYSKEQQRHSAEAASGIAGNVHGRNGLARAAADQREPQSGQPDLPMGPIDTGSMTHAELVHHFWYFFRQQVGGIKDSLAELRQEVASIKAVSQSDSSTKIAGFSEALQGSEKMWREEAARLSADIKSITAKSASPLEAISVDNTDVEKIKNQLTILDFAHHEQEQLVATLQMRVEKCEAGLDPLRADLSKLSQENQTKSAELSDLLSKSLNDLRIALQKEIVQSTSANYLHIENEVTRLQVTFEAGDQSLRTDMEDALNEHSYNIKDNLSAMTSSLRVLDSRLCEVIAEESSKCRKEASEIGGSFHGTFEKLKDSTEKDLAYMRTLIGDMSDKHHRNCSTLWERFIELDEIVKSESQEKALVHRQVNEIRSIPLIRGALSQGI